MTNLGTYYYGVNDIDNMIKYHMMAIEKDNRIAMNNLVSYYKRNEMLEELVLLCHKINNIPKLVDSLDLLLSKRQPITPQVLDIISNIELDNTASPVLRLIQRLLKQKLDIMDLHFKYSLEGKGFQEAKEDFLNMVIK